MSLSKKLLYTGRFLAGAFCCYASAVWGEGFGIDATRVIYHQPDNAVQVTLRNTTDNLVYLVRSSVVKANGEPVAGFSVVPPLVRLDAGSTAAVRIIAHPLRPLPADQESRFYFYALAIPSSNPLTKQGREMVGQVSMAMGNRIKLFYRPTGLPDPTKDSYEKLVFKRIPAGVRVDNPTPYYVNFASLSVDGRQVDMTTASVIAPFHSQTYLSDSLAKKTVTWTIINDLGGIDRYSGRIQ